MKKILFPLLLILPVTANAGYIGYESLDAGTVELGASFAKADVEGTYETQLTKLDVEATSTRLDLQLIAGIAPGINIAVALSPIGDETIETSTGNIVGTVEMEGIDDIHAQVRFRLGSGASYPVLALGATLPTGDDEQPTQEIKLGDRIVQEGKTGGRGEGTTDYLIAYGYYFGSGPQKAFIGASYTARGENDGVDYGDEVVLAGQGTIPLGSSLSLIGGVAINWEDDTVDDFGHDEADPSVELEFGGMYSINKDMEIIALIHTLNGGDTDHYDSSGAHYATSTIDSATQYSIRFKSRF